MGLPLINISRKQALCFAAFLVFYEFLTYIANDMIMPGMLNVVQSFNASESAIPTSLTAYVLGGASLQIFLGPISDRFGRRPVMLIGALLFFFFTLWIASSRSIEEFLLARYFEGMGLCFIGVIGYTVLQEIFGEMDAVRLISILATVSILAPLLGPLLGAFIVLHFSWRVIFIGIGTLAIIAFLGLWRYMPETVGVTKNNGQVIPRVSLAPRVVLTNYKNLLGDPSFVFAAIAAGSLLAPCIAWIAISPIILIADAKLSLIKYALWQIPLFSSSILGNWCLHRLTHRLSLTRIILLGSGLSLFGLFLCSVLTSYISSTFLWLIPGIIVYGLGLGITVGPLNRYALFCTPITKGTANALLSMIYMTIQGIGVEFGKHAYLGHSVASFGLFFLLTGLMHSVCLAISLRLKRV